MHYKYRLNINIVSGFSITIKKYYNNNNNNNNNAG